MRGETWFRRYGFGINEGGTPINFVVTWNTETLWLFVYVYAFGHRNSWMVKK